jgi:hypothetical protein
MRAGDGPRINRDDFVLFRKDAVAAILPDRSHLQDCVAALREIDVALDEVSVLQGEDGVRVLDMEGTEHGNWARLVRSFQKLGTAAGERENYHNALKRGCIVILFRLGTPKRPTRPAGYSPQPEVDAFCASATAG